MTDPGVGDTGSIHVHFRFLDRKAWSVRLLVSRRNLQVVPGRFLPKVSIHGLIFGKTYPFCYILLTSKKARAYKEAFGLLREKTEVQPNFILADFEVGLINALAETYPMARLNGCILLRFKSFQMVRTYLQIVR